MFNRKCKITFISHGATIYSEENRLSDNGNYPPINESGQEEIEKICEWLKKRAVKTDKIYTSSALRTIQTAQMISKVFKKDFEILDGLHSRKRGVWSGLTFEQIEQKYPQMLEQLHKNPCSYCPEGGETILDLNKRISRIIKRIVEENIGNRIIVITHPEVIQAAISGAIELPPQHQAKVYIKTGSATQISYFSSWASLMYSGYVPL
ncbi:MAG: histidine phosphatase family protein [Candidatus Gastranaerophilaceae bacterium]